MFNILLNNKQVLVLNHNTTLMTIHSQVQQFLDIDEYYLLQNGRIINNDVAISHGNIHIVLRTCGGKGGFGSMLRAIGAQIEKTTNREACRDLSGRRLRDINEEKRLKKWITQQGEREKEVAVRRQKKLEKLCEEPKHVFKDKDYDDERSQLPEMVESAVSQGLRATCSNNILKRKVHDETSCKKKPKLWIDDDLDGLSSGDSDESNDDDNIRSHINEDSESNSCNTSASNNSASNHKQITEEITAESNLGEDGGDKETKQDQQKENKNILEIIT